jgi:hypothetical protein
MAYLELMAAQPVLELGPFSDPPQLNEGEDYLSNENKASATKSMKNFTTFFGGSQC